MKSEYEALLHGLIAVSRLGADSLTIHCDSQLIVNQLTGEYMAKDERMIAYLELAKNFLKSFHKFNIERVGREHNGHADSLAGLASSVALDFRRTITVGVQDFPSIAEKGQDNICQIETSLSWMDPILDYLLKDILPSDQKEAAKVHLVQNLLYEIHEGVCGNYTGGRSLAHRAIGQGYWWPYMQKDAAQYVKHCEKCHIAPAIHKPASELNPISSPWPFAQWGFDLVGPLPRATGNRCLISDNGTQFDSGPFREFCLEFGIRNCFSSLAYPQGNGQAESSNKTILNGIKKRLKNAKGRWVEELPNAIIPLEIGLPTLRLEEFNLESNEHALAKDLDLTQERRDLAMIRLVSYQDDLRKNYGKNVSKQVLIQGDLVLRKVVGNKKDPTQGKLGANWEGPYQIISEAGLGAFNLAGMDGKPFKRPWNIGNLKKFYQ
uniref:Integrase catalytic domain-containing protein n=1 Tax=Fagus sylvatica TaxID=28930 RepID=A0A2N9GJY6_FAGSY